MKEIIKDLANQLYLGIDDNELEIYANTLEKTLQEVKALDGIDLNEIPDVSVLDKVNAFRKDEVKEYGNREILLNNAKETKDGMIKIPNALGGI